MTSLFALLLMWIRSMSKEPASNIYMNGGFFSHGIQTADEQTHVLRHDGRQYAAACEVVMRWREQGLCDWPRCYVLLREVADACLIRRRMDAAMTLLGTVQKVN